MPLEEQFVENIRWLLLMVIVSLLLLAGGTGFFFFKLFRDPEIPRAAELAVIKKAGMEHDKVWQPPDSASIAREPDGTLIQYGRDLISHTAFYLGPRGKVKSISNGMNCQNCHLWAGTKAFGNNYSAVASTYPKFRARSGAIESMEKRVNDCLERSLNGKTLEENSVEMRAIVAYFKWVGKNVEKSFAPEGAGILDLPLLQRAADSQKGKSVFEKYCVVCHGKDAIGFKHVDSIEWRYPPLAGADSYTTAAGLFRLSRFAGYVKANMPHGTYYNNPVLTDEESWDVAAYINSLPRPVKKFAADWPDLAGKPFDHPFGPYADIFSEVQHKYGPFEPIVAAKKKKK